MPDQQTIPGQVLVEEKPKTPVEEYEVEIFSTDLEIEEARRKLEKQQDTALKKIELLMRRRRVLVRGLAQERERGGGWTPMHGRKFDQVTGELLDGQARP